MTPVASLPAAGRALDTLIRDAIFGPWDESRCRVCGWIIVPDGEQGCWRDNCSMRPPPLRRADEPPPFSTDIAAAWQLVEHFHKDCGPAKWCFMLEDVGRCDDEPEDIACWNATIHGHEGYGKTAPLAICLAALKAVAP